MPTAFERPLRFFSIWDTCLKMQRPWCLFPCSFIFQLQKNVIRQAPCGYFLDINVSFNTGYIPTSRDFICILVNMTAWWDLGAQWSTKMWLTTIVCYQMGRVWVLYRTGISTGLTSKSPIGSNALFGNQTGRRPTQQKWPTHASTMGYLAL